MNKDHERGRRVRIALIPFAIATSALTAACVLWFFQPFARELHSLLIGLVFTVLVFDLPVCVIVLVQWVSTGHPPELSLEPLVASREEKEFRKTLRERPKMDADVFYQRFYLNSPITKTLVTRLRGLLEYQLGLPVDSIQPDDNLIYADPELDWQYLLDEINEEFQIDVPADSVHSMNGTFDDLLKGIAPHYRETLLK